MSLTHINSSGNPVMVDVSDKGVTKRIATAQASIQITPEIMQLLENDEIISKKGPVIQTAIIAGIMAAKRTSELIPLCHPLSLDNCQVNIVSGPDDVFIIQCTATISGRTGVEMEALTGVCIAALTIYDMCKAYSHDIRISDIRLLHKSGGKKEIINE